MNFFSSYTRQSPRTYSKFVDLSVDLLSANLTRGVPADLTKGLVPAQELFDFADPHDQTQYDH